MAREMLHCWQQQGPNAICRTSLFFGPSIAQERVGGSSSQTGPVPAPGEMYLLVFCGIFVMPTFANMHDGC